MLDTTMMKLEFCQYENTCENKSATCWENHMTEIHAKPIIKDKFWIVEKDGEKFATLRKIEDERFVLSNETGIKIYDNKESLTKQFGKDFFVAKIVKEANGSLPNEVQAIQLVLNLIMLCSTSNVNYRCSQKVKIVKVYIVPDTMSSVSIKVG